MRIKSTLSLTAVAIFVLSLATLVQLPAVVQASDCSSEGGSYGLTCRDAMGPGAMCQYCVAYECDVHMPDDPPEEECTNTCVDAGSIVCFS